MAAEGQCNVHSTSPERDATLNDLLTFSPWNLGFRNTSAAKVDLHWDFVFKLSGDNFLKGFVFL